MSDVAIPVRPAPSMVEQRSSDYRDMYANFSRVGLSHWDIGVMFGILNDYVPEQPDSVTTHTYIRMSPQQFKVFANALPAIMAAWEAKFGEVNLLPGVLMPPPEIQNSVKQAMPGSAVHQSPPSRRKRL